MGVPEKSGIDEWNGRRNLPPAGVKLHILHFTMDGRSRWLNLLKKRFGCNRPEPEPNLNLLQKVRTSARYEWQHMRLGCEIFTSSSPLAKAHQTPHLSAPLLSPHICEDSYECLSKCGRGDSECRHCRLDNVAHCTRYMCIYRVNWMGDFINYHASVVMAQRLGYRCVLPSIFLVLADSKEQEEQNM